MRLVTGWVSLEADSKWTQRILGLLANVFGVNSCERERQETELGRGKSLCHTGPNTASESSGALFSVGPRWPGLYNLTPIRAWMLATWARQLFAAEATPCANGTPSCWGSKPVTESSLAWCTSVSYYDIQIKNR